MITSIDLFRIKMYIEKEFSSVLRTPVTDRAIGFNFLMQQPEEAMEYFISCSQTLISLYVYLKGNLIKLSCELLSSNVYILILSWGPLCQQFWSQLRYWSVVCTGANFIYGLSKLCYVLHRCFCNICCLDFTLLEFS